MHLQPLHQVPWYRHLARQSTASPRFAYPQSSQLWWLTEGKRTAENGPDAPAADATNRHGMVWRAWRGSAAGLTILGRHHLSPQHTAAPRSFITLSHLHSLRRLKAMQFQTLAHRLLQLTQLRTVPGLSLRYIQQSPSEQLKAVAGLQQLVIP